MVHPSRRESSLQVDERRRYPRVKAPILFRASPFAPTLQPVHDIGIGGLRVRCPDPLRVNDEHTVGLVLPSGRELRCRVRVAWSGSDRMGDHEAGLQILGADADIRDVWQVLEDLPEPAAVSELGPLD